jgi:surface antigen
MACQALAACALAGPPGASDSEPTGSIAPVAAKRSPGLPVALDDEDRRRALGALAIALDPQGNGATVHWDNPISKARGSVTPAGFAYPANDLICRDFNAQFTTAAGPETARGAACRDKNAQWTLAELRPAN